MRAMDISSYVAGNKLRIKVEEQRRLDFSNEGIGQRWNCAGLQVNPGYVRPRFLQYLFAAGGVQQITKEDISVA